VEKVNPDLVGRDAEGKVFTVCYEAVNAMLPNEFLKEHRKVEEQDRTVQEQEASITQLKSALTKQEATIAEQQKGFESKIAHQQEQIEALTAGLQKVSAQVEMSRPAPQMVFNNQ
jgi:multidrug resistance efflux pump